MSDDHGSEGPSQIGRTLSGRYRIEEPIATGGMGAVYLGKHLHMKKRVAIKLLLPRAGEHPQLVARFEREGVVGAQVSHPNVAAATDFGQAEDGTRFLVMEHVEGPSLAELIAKGPLPAERAVPIAAEIAAALEAVHEAGIVHRDLKPRNVIAGETIKLIDFGFAKVDTERLSLAGDEEPGTSRALTTATDAFGTVAYMAPEVLKGMANLDGRADLYALGVILYEMLAGALPFTGKDAELFAAKREQTPPPIAERTPGVTVPPALEALVMQLLAVDPDERFASASALRQALSSPELGTEPGADAEPDPDPDPDADGDPAPASSPEDRALPPPKTRDGTVVMLPSEDARSGNIVGRVQERLVGLAKRKELILAAVGPGLAALVLVVWLASRGDDEAETSAPPSRVDRPAYAPIDAPPASATPSSRPTAVGGRSEAAWRERLLESASRRAWMAGAEALLALAELSPQAFAEPSIRKAAVGVAVGMGTVEHERTDAVFRALGDELGEPGLGVLYEIIATKGGTEAYSRTRELLADPSRRQRMSPALAVALDLRLAKCEDKRALFERAAEVGDERALKQLQILEHQRCRAGSPCCFRDDDQLEAAIARLEGGG